MEIIKTAVASCGERYIRYMLTKERYDGETTYSLLIASGEARRALFDITTSEEKAKRVFDLFYKGAVTPECAPFVFDDIAADPQML